MLTIWKDDFRRTTCKAQCCYKSFDLGLVPLKVYPGIIRSILLSTFTKLWYKTPMVYLYRLPYIKSYRMFLFQLSNQERWFITEKFLHLFDLQALITWPMAATEWYMLNLSLKDVKYIDSGGCLGSINHGYVFYSSGGWKCCNK